MGDSGALLLGLAAIVYLSQKNGGFMGAPPITLPPGNPITIIIEYLGNGGPLPSLPTLPSGRLPGVLPSTAAGPEYIARVRRALATIPGQAPKPIPVTPKIIARFSREPINEQPDSPEPSRGGGGLGRR